MICQKSHNWSLETRILISSSLLLPKQTSKKLFLSCSLIYKSIDIDMYKILFNPQTNPETELLLFIQVAH